LLLKTVRHFFPELSSVINQIKDPRKADQCVYSQAHLIWLGILLFMMHLGSRRQLRFERRDAEAFKGNLDQLSGQNDQDDVADPDTLAYYAERVPVEALEKVLAFLVKWLIRMKALDPSRLYGYFTIGVDGRHVEAHPLQCLI